MDRYRLGIVLIVEADRSLLGIVTDGDIRRAILAKLDFNESVQTLLNGKAGTAFATPITAPVGTDRKACLELLQQHRILHLPLVDEDGRVAGLVTRDDFLPSQAVPVQAVVMAGGAGRRLQPLTNDVPKPMLPVGDRPMMEIIIEQLRTSGIRRVNVTLHHQADKITRHFGNGLGFGVDIHYVTEDRPLGTAGALGLMTVPAETLLVINGDVLTQVDFRAMLAYHRESNADLTVAVTRFELQVPYGVVECVGTQVSGLVEKPSVPFFVNAGIYLIEPNVFRFIPGGACLDMTDLIQRLIHERYTVVSFPIREHWLDIGNHDDYARAQQVVKEWKLA